MNNPSETPKVERPRLFYKYVSASTAKLVLSHTRLRWSSPLLFNDPFDVPRELAPPIERQKLAAAVLVRLRELVEHPPRTLEQLHPGIADLILKLNAVENPELRALALKSINSVELSPDISFSALEGLHAEWNAILPKLRILCLTQSPKHVAMWYHYADKYTGVVLALAATPEHESAWLAAKPVSYPNIRPELYTLEGWVRLVTERSSVSVDHLLNLALYTKSTDWQYEDEWRVALQTQTSDGELFSDVKFHPNDLIGVYMGPRISLHNADVLRGLVQGYPTAQLYSIRIGSGPELEIQQTT